MIVEFLHHHHGGEDRLLWPRLLQRVGEESAPIVPLMEAQHESISAQLDEVERLRTPYAATAGESEEGMGTLPKRKLPLAFGMTQYEGDPETLAEMIAGAPLPVRLIVPPLARRAFRKHALRVHGTETPDWVCRYSG